MDLFPKHELKENDPVKVESAAAGELIPEGFYRLKLDSIVQGESKLQGTPFVEFNFLFQEGNLKNTRFKDVLWLSPKEKMIQWKIMYGKRLGLLEVFDDGGKPAYRKVAGKDDFRDCYGVEVVAHIEVDSNDKENDEGKSYRPKNRIKMFGLYHVGDPAIPELIEGLKSKGLKAAKAESKGKGKGKDAKAEEKPKDKYDDL